ncbi:hypothetical protein LC55x_2861 [Lysobacter capsici]|nr:hypothetical protein LC55x_2861 [Lysobacter capsici]
MPGAPVGAARAATAGPHVRASNSRLKLVTPRSRLTPLLQHTPRDCDLTGSGEIPTRTRRASRSRRS